MGNLRCRASTVFGLSCGAASIEEAESTAGQNPGDRTMRTFAHNLLARITPIVCALVAQPDSVRAQHAGSVDPVEQAIDDVIRGSSPAEERSPDPKKDQPGQKGPQVEMLPGGIKHEVFPDGREVFTRPDGTKQYVSPGGTKVTLRPNGDRVIQTPGEDAKYLPPRIDDRDGYRPHRRPTGVPVPSQDNPNPTVPEFRMPEPPRDGRRHAPWVDLSNDSGSSGLHALPSDQWPRSAYNPPPQGSADNIVGQTKTITLPGVWKYKSGATQYELPDGKVVTTYPGLPTANIQDRNGQPQRLTSDPDGAIRYKSGDTTLTIDPATGQTFVQGPNAREVIGPGPGGNIAVSDGNGGREVRGPNGELIRSSVTDPNSGYGIRQQGSGPPIMTKDGQPVAIATLEGGVWVARGPDGKAVRGADGKEVRLSDINGGYGANPSSVRGSSTSAASNASGSFTVRQGSDGIPKMYQDGNYLGVASREGFNYVFRGGKGEVVKVNELFDRSTGTIAGRIATNAGYQQTPRTGQKPDLRPVTIFDLTRSQVERLQRQGALSTAERETLERLKAVEKAVKDLPPSKPGTKPEDELDRTLKMVQATLGKSDAERDLQRAQQEYEKQKASFDKETQRIDEQDAKLRAREDAARRPVGAATIDALTRMVEQNGFDLERTQLDQSEDALKKREEAAKNDLDTALKRVDYKKYDRCPNKESWDSCGHADIKKKWLNEQLAGLLGKAGVDRIKQVAKDRVNQDKERKDLESREKAFKKRVADEDAARKKLDDDAAVAKAERQQLTTKKVTLQVLQEQSKGEVDKLTKQVADFDSAIKKYMDPP